MGVEKGMKILIRETNEVCKLIQYDRETGWMSLEKEDETTLDIHVSKCKAVV